MEQEKKLTAKDKEPINQQLYKEVASELDLPLKVVKDIIINGQSKFTSSIMASNTFGTIRWPYLGAFKAKTHVANVLTYMKGLTPEQKKFFRDQYYLKKEAKKQKFKEEKEKKRASKTITKEA